MRARKLANGQTVTVHNSQGLRKRCAAHGGSGRAVRTTGISASSGPARAIG
jgi:hypothetical protein